MKGLIIKIYPPITATDHMDSYAYPMDFIAVHQLGIPHRVVHIEIVNVLGQFFAWERADGRLEILGGHVDWIEVQNRPESYEEAALREISEELNLTINWKITNDDALERMRDYMSPIEKFVNQIPGANENNNEWVTAYRLIWQKEWEDPSKFILSDEGNRFPSWFTVEDIILHGLKHPMGINSALRLFLRRRGVLIPIINNRAKDSQ